MLFSFSLSQRLGAFRQSSETPLECIYSKENDGAYGINASESHKPEAFSVAMSVDVSTLVIWGLSNPITVLMTNTFIFSKLILWMYISDHCPENKAFLNEMYELNFVTFYR